MWLNGACVFLPGLVLLVRKDGIQVPSTAAQTKLVRLKDRVLLLIVLVTGNFEETVLLEVTPSSPVCRHQVVWGLSEVDHRTFDVANGLSRRVNAQLFLTVIESSNEIRRGRALVVRDVLVADRAIHDRWRLLTTPLLVQCYEPLRGEVRIFLGPAAKVITRCDRCAIFLAIWRIACEQIRG